MSRIEEMIERLCPDGVEFKPLGEVATLYSGLSGKTKSDFSGNGNALYVTYKNVFSHAIAAVDEFEPVCIATDEKQNRVEIGDILFTASSENPEDAGMSAVVIELPSRDVYLNSFCFGLRFNDRTKYDDNYLKHLFRAREIRKEISATANGVTRFNISKKLFLKIKIPVPPLEIQKEIATVLDSFADLEADLEAELEARKRQYAYYRDKLLTFDDVNSANGGGYDPKLVKWMTLGEVLYMKAGEAIKSEEIADSNDSGMDIPCYGGNGLRGYVELPNQFEDAVLIGRQGALCGNVKYARAPFYATEHAVVVRPKTKSSLRFLFHLLSAAKLQKYKTAGAQPGLSVSRLSKALIPIPPLAEQQRIVDILDRFDSLTTSLTDGLPAEIEARRKQYEYYRDKLLAFKEKAA